MKLRDKKAFAAMALIALVTFQAGSAWADDTADNRTAFEPYEIVRHLENAVL
jgi:hypothetical protein